MFFFFKQKTAYEMRISDWSSDVCSSDLREPLRRRPAKSSRLKPLLQKHGAACAVKARPRDRLGSARTSPARRVRAAPRRTGAAAPRSGRSRAAEIGGAHI